MRPSYLYNGNSYTGKMTSFYWDGSLSYYKDETILRSFYLYNKNSFIDKMTSLYWISPLAPTLQRIYEFIIQIL